jgi:hypothetical protein
MMLLPGLQLAGDRRLSLGLTRPYDRNVYLITAGRETLVAGTGGGLDTDG